jgi:hypothetical protein
MILHDSQGVVGQWGDAGGALRLLPCANVPHVRMARRLGAQFAC